MEKRFLLFFSRIGSAVVVATPKGLWRAERRRRCRARHDGACSGEVTTTGLCAGHLIDDIEERLKLAVAANLRPPAAP